MEIPGTMIWTGARWSSQTTTGAPRRKTICLCPVRLTVMKNRMPTKAMIWTLTTLPVRILMNRTTIPQTFTSTCPSVLRATSPVPETAIRVMVRWVDRASGTYVNGTLSFDDDIQKLNGRAFLPIYVEGESEVRRVNSKDVEIMDIVKNVIP